MLGSPTWLPSHLLLLLGTALATVGFVTTRRAALFGRSVDRWLAAAAVGWGLATVELVPHLVAARDADGLAHHHATPVLDLHLALQVVATPLMGLTGAALAIAVARSARSLTAWALAVPAVLGGLGYAASAPLIAATGSLCTDRTVPAAGRPRTVAGGHLVAGRHPTDRRLTGATDAEAPRQSGGLRTEVRPAPAPARAPRPRPRPRCREGAERAAGWRPRRLRGGRRPLR